MKYSELWDNLQLMPTKDNLPENATYLKADKDEGYIDNNGEIEYWYGDGSNHFREFLENLIAIPAKMFFWKKPPKPIKEMFYSYANVVMELLKTPVSKNGLKGLKITDKPKVFVYHSRGVWILAQAVLLAVAGYNIKECVAFGIPNEGGRKFLAVLTKLGIKVTLFVVDGDWVANRPFFGDHYYTKLIPLKNRDNLKGIKAIHLSYGLYLEQEGL